MPLQRPWIRALIIFAGLGLALIAGVLAVVARQWLIPESPDSSGMQAFGDLILGLTVAAVLAVFPAALAFYWLKNVRWFWTALAGLAAGWSLSGLLALVAGLVAGNCNQAWRLAVDARIGFMVLSAPACCLAGFFAPGPWPRRILLTAGLIDGVIVTGVILIKFVLPQLPFP